MQTQTEPELLGHRTIVSIEIGGSCLAMARSGQPSGADSRGVNTEGLVCAIRPVVRNPTGRINIYAMAIHPTVGVEEEFLLVDPHTGEPVACNEQVAAHAADHGVKLQLELTSCQIETTTGVIGGSGDLRAELTRLRHIAAEAAKASGAQLLAAALPPIVPHEFPITDTPRYREIADKFGMVADEQGICGCHVHVSVPSRQAAVLVSNLLESHEPAPTRELLDRLVDRVRPALEAVGDYGLVRAELDRVGEQGNGAMRQRRAWRRRGEVADVIADVAAATVA